jgi:hypothetical protein
MALEEHVGRADGTMVVRAFGYGWVGHIYAQKYRGPGTWRFAFIYFVPSGMRSTQKVPGTSARCQASFPIALKLFTKTFLVGSINRV